MQIIKLNLPLTDGGDCPERVHPIIDIFLELFPPSAPVSDFMYFKMPLVHSSDFSSIDNVNSLPVQTKGYSDKLIFVYYLTRLKITLN